MITDHTLKELGQGYMIALRTITGELAAMIIFDLEPPKYPGVTIPSRSVESIGCDSHTFPHSNVYGVVIFRHLRVIPAREHPPIDDASPYKIFPHVMPNLAWKNSYPHPDLPSYRY